MNRRHFISLAACGALAAVAGDAAAQSPPRTRSARPYRDDLMTDVERGRFDRDMRNARTDRERERVRSEQRGRVDDRAGIGAAENVAPYRAPAAGWPGATDAQGTAPAGVTRGVSDAQTRLR